MNKDSSGYCSKCDTVYDKPHECGVFKISEARYRIQYAEQYRFAQWSEWRALDVPITEPLILGVHVNEQCSKKELAKLMQCNIK